MYFLIKDVKIKVDINSKKNQKEVKKLFSKTIQNKNLQSSTLLIQNFKDYQEYIQDKKKSFSVKNQDKKDSKQDIKIFINKNSSISNLKDSQDNNQLICSQKSEFNFGNPGIRSRDTHFQKINLNTTENEISQTQVIKESKLNLKPFQTEVNRDLLLSDLTIARKLSKKKLVPLNTKNSYKQIQRSKINLKNITIDNKIFQNIHKKIQVHNLLITPKRSLVNSTSNRDKIQLLSNDKSNESSNSSTDSTQILNSVNKVKDFEQNAKQPKRNIINKTRSPSKSEEDQRNKGNNLFD